jgi:hypothetical protein
MQQKLRLVAVVSDTLCKIPTHVQYLHHVPLLEAVDQTIVRQKAGGRNRLKLKNVLLSVYNQHKCFNCVIILLKLHSYVYSDILGDKSYMPQDGVAVSPLGFTPMVTP